MSIPTPLDAQFHRAVDVVQSLPKGGPLQTSYDEQLYLYSLYKQATEGDNTKSRPGVLDMINRKKWDAWAKQKGVDKAEAKQLYVTALLKIFKRFEGQNELARDLVNELEAYGAARAPSPASSTSSYHSSQASLPSPPLLAAATPPVAPDPHAPAPDVAPHFIPPSALNASHRSLVSLAQHSHSHAPSRTHTYAPSVPSQHHARSPALDGYDVSGPASVAAAASAVPLRAPSSAGPASRPQSLAGSRRGGAGPSSAADPRFSIQSLPARRPAAPPQPSALGFVPDSAGTRAAAGHLPAGLGASSHASLAFTPSLAYTPDTRQGSPAPAAIPLLGIYHPTPTYPRPPSASTFSQPGGAHGGYGAHGAPAPMPDVAAALLQIQTSLSALHERLSTLERTHAAALRGQQRGRGSWFWASTDEDALDDADDADARAAAWAAHGAGTGGGVYGGTARAARVRVRRRGLGLRVVWLVLAALRRAAVDVGVGAAIALALALMLGGGWRRARGAVSRLRAGARLLVAP